MADVLAGLYGQRLPLAVGAAAALGGSVLVCLSVQVLRCWCRPPPPPPPDDVGALPQDHLLPKSPRPRLALPGKAAPDSPAAVPAGVVGPPVKLNGTPAVHFNEVGVKLTLRGTGYALDQGVAHPTPHKARYLVSDEDGRPCSLAVTTVDTRRTACPIHQEASAADFAALLMALHHPHLAAIGFATFSLRQQATYVVHRLPAIATLRDVTQLRAFRAAASPRSPSPDGSVLPDPCIGRYGQHILEGLKALRHVGFPYPQLSACSVLVVHDVCQLADLEDAFTGRHPPSCYPGLRLGIEEFRFGQVLIEMATGGAPEEAALLRNVLRADADPDASDREIAELLHGKGPRRRGSPALEALLQALYAPESEVALEDLLADDFFRRAPGPGPAGGTASPKLSSQHRDILHGIARAMAAIDLQDSPVTTPASSWCRFEALV
eukprot:EG_transcript_5549